MDTNSVLRLLPPPHELRSLRGLYLNDEFPSASAEVPFVYGNFITSLDGRIALADGDEEALRHSGTQSGPISGSVATPANTGVPDAIANPRDWRLFQELAVRADVLLVSGSYLRRRAAGSAQEVLAIEDSPETSDLRSWRGENGLSARPDVAALSRSLDFPVPPELVDKGRRFWVLTTDAASPEREASLVSLGAEVVRLPGGRLEGRGVIRALAERGCRRIYNAAGPSIHHLLLTADRPDRIYLTLAPRIVGGHDFFSLVSGAELTPPARFRLRSLHLDPEALSGDGQLFASYERPPTH